MSGTREKSELSVYCHYYLNTISTVFLKSRRPLCCLVLVEFIGTQNIFAHWKSAVLAIKSGHAMDIIYKD